METKNVIIQNFANSLVEAASSVSSKTVLFTDNVDENKAIIATLNVLIESVRAQTVLLQQAIDNYI